MSHDCPYAREGVMIECTLASEVTGVKKIVSRPFCESCKASWTAGPPTLDNPPAWIGDPSPRPTAPSWADRLKTATAAFLRYLASGGKRTDRTTRAARIATCAACPDRGEALRQPTCNRCGCFLRLKAQLPAEHCPMGLWENGKAKCCGKT